MIVKAVILGVAGIGGMGAAAFVGGGGGPDDFIGHVNKPPQAVYAAFSALGPEGEVSAPARGGWGSGFKQRIVKVAGEQVKLEFEVDGAVLISADIQFSPEGDGTRIAAEVDFDEEAMREMLRKAGGTELPAFAYEEYLLDQAFAHVMKEAVSRIEEGKPLHSLHETRARWGRDGSTRGSRVTPQGAGGGERREAVRPQLDARPAIDPNAAARRPVGSDGPSR